GEADESGALYGLGVAAGASLIAQRIFDGAGASVEPFPSDDVITRDAIRAGAQIGANSWGNDVQGAYDLDCAAFDELVRDGDLTTQEAEPYILEFSAGNAGPASQTMDSPAGAKNVLATGASENGGLIDFGIYNDGADTMADFSSRGPCEDGRIKPDVVAPGTFIASLLSAAASDEFAWLPISGNYIYMGGTSQAGAHAAGAAAVFVQYYKSVHTNAVPSPALVKAALINSAEELDQANGGPGPIPNNDEGWGRISLPNIIVTNTLTAERICEFIDQTTPLTNGQVYEHHVFVQTANQPLKITLTYTDVAGFPGAIPALVNDLDLEVVSPDGTVYRGNQFVGGESMPVTEAPAADNLNNVEAVHLAQPDYIVRLRARRVVQDSRVDTAAVDQDFALAISGDLSRTGIGVVLLDRAFYTAPGLMQVTVFDSGRAGDATVNVFVENLTEPNGWTVTLSAVAGVSGMFTGSVATVVGGSPAVGKLVINNGNAIEARYVDAHGVTRTTAATARLLPPVISNLAAAVDLGLMTITWQTDEPADSVVRYSTNFTFSLATTNAELSATHTIRLYNLAPGQTYHFLVSSTDEAGNTATATNGGAYYSFVAVPTPTVLLVDAYEVGEGSAQIDDGVYTNALAASGYSFAFWKVTGRGRGPQLADLRPFQAVIWRVTDDAINYTGTNNTLNAAQQAMIQSYVNGGGSFLLSSMEILSRMGDVPFRRNVLQVGKFLVNTDPFSFSCANCDEDFGVPAIRGLIGSAVTDGLDAPLDYANYPFFDLGEGFPTYGPDFSDTFTPTTNATAIVFESASGRTCGMSYPKPGVDVAGRVVFLSFPIDTLLAGGSGPNNETNLLRNILNFLVPGVNGRGEIALDSSAYTVPSLVTVEVGDTDLTSVGAAQVSFTSTSATNPVVITVNETPHRGLFRGYITLVTNAPATNQLLVADGDVITARYFDASAGSNVTATAVVDLQPAIIGNVVAVPKYFEAAVSWTTSKPADALVQFGESQLLGRTAYAAALATNRTVMLSGLVPNRNYYYQVVSRDNAGNTTVDDNAGNFHLFHTLLATTTPWTDHLDTGATNWTVVAGDSSQVNWELGVPENGRETAAHSAPSAWGSNLRAQAIDYTDSYLFTPPIDLTLAASATLGFWHSYDFTSPDLIELGEVMIATNFTVAQAVTINTYTNDSTAGWSPESIDLTPYAGKTVMLVWHYAEFTLGGSAPPAGWLVDDVSVTASNRQTGTILVTNNLWQSRYTLSGLASYNGRGVSAVISNAPVGQYVMTFAAVPYYQTPPPQTNALAPAGLLTFTGNYYFADTNSNGLPAAWEQHFFGSPVTNRTTFTDTDGDGVSDYREFVAGTDPANPASAFRLTASLQTNRQVQLLWSSVLDRGYRVHGSTNGTTWSPCSDWIQADTPNTLLLLPPPTNNTPNLFRVEVRP
ncbi:MAG: S8 family serine peptidase, partial [Verrucomicrobia bacterium]|nr:S8 family serine peptidase [Verrucomicrobiota bacterium]